VPEEMDNTVWEERVVKTLGVPEIRVPEIRIPWIPLLLVALLLSNCMNWIALHDIKKEIHAQTSAVSEELEGSPMFGIPEGNAAFGLPPEGINGRLDSIESELDAISKNTEH
jgi:hypothetical protein